MSPDLNLALKIAELVADSVERQRLQDVDRKAKELAAACPESDADTGEIATVLRDELRAR